jgi:hydroxypyruvate isomerase
VTSPTTDGARSAPSTTDLRALGERIPDLAVNCSILYGAQPVHAALAEVRRSGLGAVEFWWPFASARPTVAEVDAFVEAILASGLELVALNLFAGDMGAGDRGILSWPGHEAQFRASVEVARRIQDATGCKVFNALYGRRRAGLGEGQQDACAVANLEHACAVLAPGGATVVIEPLSGLEDYPLKTAEQVMEVVGSVRPSTANVGMLLDVYHLWANGDDVARSIDRYGSSVAHVQLADGPGRGEPGSGELPLLQWVDRLRHSGYSGRFALEYMSTNENPLARLQEGRDH